ncbi:MAG: tetratricopeptide repeat protein [Ardenticatenaceae bacterium]|nr:tetratricopeptide repeat protein [Ardenticatenaceae bacterium]
MMGEESRGRSTNWQFERESWTDFYENQLQRQLAQALSFIRSQTESLQLKEHFDSFLVLLRRARSHSNLHIAYINLLTALHPWPLRWGEWDAWELELQQAIPVLAAHQHIAQQAELMTYLAEIQFRTGRLETAVQTSHNAANIAWKSGEVTAWAAATSRGIYALNRLGRNDEARQLLAHGEAQLTENAIEAPQLSHLEASGHLLLRRMVFMRYDGIPGEAARRAQMLITTLSNYSQVDKRLLATLYTDQATMLWAADQYDTAVSSLKKAIGIYTELGDTYEAITTRGNLGIVYWSMARLGEAETAIRDSLQLAETFHARLRIMNEMGNLCAISFSRGKLVQALSFTERHLALAQEADDAAEINRAYGNRAMALLYLGDYEAALPLLEESLDRLHTLGLLQQLAQTYAHLSCCLDGLGRREEAITAVAQAENLIQNIESPSIQVLILRCRARLTPLQEATNLVKQALALARRHSQRLDEGICLLRLALLSSGLHQAQFWEEGSAIINEIGAEAWLDGRSLQNPPTLATIL